LTVNRGQSPQKVQSVEESLQALIADISVKEKDNVLGSG
jgi:hypothetical protein